MQHIFKYSFKEKCWMYKYCDENPYRFDNCGVQWGVDNILDVIHTSKDALPNVWAFDKVLVVQSREFSRKHMISILKCFMLRINKEQKLKNSYSIYHREYISIFSPYKFYNMHWYVHSSYIQIFCVWASIATLFHIFYVFTMSLIL